MHEILRAIKPFVSSTFSGSLSSFRGMEVICPRFDPNSPKSSGQRGGLQINSSQIQASKRPTLSFEGTAKATSFR